MSLAEEWVYWFRQAEAVSDWTEPPAVNDLAEAEKALARRLELGERMTPSDWREAYRLLDACALP